MSSPSLSPTADFASSPSFGPAANVTSSPSLDPTADAVLSPSFGRRHVATFQKHPGHIAKLEVFCDIMQSLAKGCSLAWGLAPSIHILLMWPLIDQASLLVSCTSGASDVATLLMLLLRSWLKNIAGSDKPNKCCRCWPAFTMAAIKSDLTIGSNLQSDCHCQS